jgi:hypothetical protein
MATIWLALVNDTQHVMSRVVHVTMPHGRPAPPSACGPESSGPPSPDPLLLDEPLLPDDPLALDVAPLLEALPPLDVLLVPLAPPLLEALLVDDPLPLDVLAPLAIPLPEPLPPDVVPPPPSPPERVVLLPPQATAPSAIAATAPNGTRIMASSSGSNQRSLLDDPRLAGLIWASPLRSSFANLTCRRRSPRCRATPRWRDRPSRWSTSR